jgi:4-hydroxybenzoate polyprenyltransferase
MGKFFALSRTTHGVLDLAAPGFAAVLWLGGFPDWRTLLLSVITAFAAYTAIYALNDLMGIRCDQEKFATGAIKEGYSVEASEMRYPLAQNVLSIQSGILWFVGWIVVAISGAWVLNPAIIAILAAAAILEILYCLLLKVTYWRILISGLVKSSGPVAAVFAVDPNPDLEKLFLVIIWMMFWEFGGQNIPADWNDTEEDLRVGATTIPIRLGFQKAGLIVLLALSLTVVISLTLPAVSPLPQTPLYLVGGILAGFFLLLIPGYQIFRSYDEGRLAAKLFDRASYYPLSMLVIISLVALIY